MGQIIISWYNKQEVRQERLIKLLNTIEWDYLESTILRVHDHKGTLSVVWDGKPAIKDMLYVGNIWDVIFGEPNMENHHSDEDFLIHNPQE
jgi:hypothetical protein